MKKYKVIICAFIFNSFFVKATIVEINTGAAYGLAVCPSQDYYYQADYPITPNMGKVFWSVKNGVFGDGSTTYISDPYNRTVTVKWNNVKELGYIKYEIFGTYPVKEEAAQVIRSVANLTISSVQSEGEFGIINNTITIPRERSGSIILKIPKTWYNSGYTYNSQYQVSRFQWNVPKSLGGSGNWTAGDSIRTIYYDKVNGDGEKILVRAMSECGNINTFGNIFTITFRRTGIAFNGIIENQILVGSQYFSHTDLILRESVYVHRSSNITFYGTHSIRILPNFRNEDGAILHFYCNAPKSTVLSVSEITDDIINPDDDTECNDSITQQQSCLYQNYPNPFTGHTNITYFINRYSKSAYIAVQDITGNLVKKINISAFEKNTCLFDAIGLAKGIYYYSLYVDNKKIDTKCMIYAN